MLENGPYGTLVSKVRGTWELERVAHNDGPHTEAWGPFPPDGVKVPVVPCDAGAVVRLAQHLSREDELGFIWTEGGSPHIEKLKRRYEERACKYLRAAARKY